MNWKKAACVSPVDSALFFSHYSLEVSELEKAVMEIVQVENTRQQEGRGNENPDEQLAQLELLQAQGFQTAFTNISKETENYEIKLKSLPRLLCEELLKFGRLSTAKLNIDSVDKI